jgi:hypothetical protein
MRCPKSALATITLLSALTGLTAHADTLTIRATRDTTIYAENNRLSNGSGESIFSGNTANGFTRRALMRFDLSAIPANATITSARLTLQLDRSNRAGLETYRLHRLTANWGEGTSNASGSEGGGAFAAANDATWSYRFYNTASPTSSPAWTTPGGDFIALPSSELDISATLGPFTFTGPGLASDVQFMVQNAASNFGWILIGNESLSATAKRFVARESASVSQRPTLVVTFTLPPAPSCDYDFNRDENVDLTDAQLMAQVAAGIITADPSWLDGDLNGDENADLTDAQILAAYVATGTCGV